MTNSRPMRRKLAETLKEVFWDHKTFVDWYGIVDDILNAVDEDSKRLRLLIEKHEQATKP